MSAITGSHKQTGMFGKFKETNICEEGEHNWHFALNHPHDSVFFASDIIKLSSAWFIEE